MNKFKIVGLAYTALSCEHKEVFTALQKKYGFILKHDTSFGGSYYMIIERSYFHLCSYWGKRGETYRRWGGA